MSNKDATRNSHSNPLILPQTKYEKKMKHVIKQALLPIYVFILQGTGICSEVGNSGQNSDRIKKYALLESRLEEMRELSTDLDLAKQQLGGLMKMCGRAPEPVRRLGTEAVCAGLISIGANDAYSKARSSLVDANGLEAIVLEACQVCTGSGGRFAECRDCHGSGRCPIPSCNDGRRELPSLAGSSGGMVVACSTCKGTGKCQTCHGNGNIRLFVEFSGLTRPRHYGFGL